MARKERADGAAAMVRAAQGAALPISPPSNVPLEGRDLGFFANVLAEFPRADWTSHGLELAAMLARTLADLEDEQRQMRSEGSVIVTDRGHSVVNPRKTVIQMHAATILSFRRSLALHARARAGDNRDVAKQRDMGKAVEDANGFDDELFARPS